MLTAFEITSMSHRVQTDADERRARMKSMKEASQTLKLQLQEAGESTTRDERRSRRIERLLGSGRPIYSKVAAKACSGLIICGARGEGPKELTGIKEDLAVAAHVFEWRGVALQTVDVNELGPARGKVNCLPG